MPTSIVPDVAHVYAVTAADAVRGPEPTFIRVTRTNLEVADSPVYEWHFHPTADVAAVPSDFKNALLTHGGL